jgi:transposase
MFSYVLPEKRVRADHPLRPIRKMVDKILKEMSPQFAKLYSEVGRPSIAPERLFRSLLLQIFYSVRSERMLIEQLQYNLLFRWFVGMEMDEAVWNHAVFSKNRERLHKLLSKMVVRHVSVPQFNHPNEGVLADYERVQVTNDHLQFPLARHNLLRRYYRPITTVR